MRYGLFNQGYSDPIEVYEGDRSRMDRPPYVEIFRDTGPETSIPVAHIHLSAGQTVKVIEDPANDQCTHIPGVRRS